MKAAVQRVRSASVCVDGAAVGQINQGLLVYLGVAAQDGPAQIRWLADKIANLRIFDASSTEKTSLSVRDIGGAVLVISQFTLLADARKGRRPSFSGAAAPDVAKALYETFIAELSQIVPVESGVFAADMQVESVNDGPFTLLLEHPTIAV
ncbi:MAG: D-aminoacyl-tRNA deacylase [Gammaproteobacteria bacterium]|jgi:D-tyrosyl-tRNA(Tyr) deacylase